ncbi:MAG: hypothetical protein ACRYHA_11895 [Janthinobacterium lividum]
MNSINPSARHDADGLRQALERATAPGKAYLGDPKVVEKLVRDLAAGIFSRYSAVGQGHLAAAQAKQADRAAIDALASILQGAHADFSAVGNWNPAGLAASVRTALDKRLSQPAMTDNALAIHEATALFGLALYQLLGELGKSGDEEAVRIRTEAAVVFYSNLFVGLPQ